MSSISRSWEIISRPVNSFFTSEVARSGSAVALIAGLLRSRGVQTASKTLVVLGLLYGANKFLNNLVLRQLSSTHAWNWEMEIILVTGGSGAIGGLIVQGFAKRNITVVVFDIKPPLAPLPPNVHFYQVDVASADAVHEAAEKVRSDIGDPTILINNAGIVLGESLLDCTRAGIQQMFGINTLAHFWLVQEFLPAMIKSNHGHVVTMASMASFIVLADNIDYSCTKAAAVAFHEGLGQELKHRYNASNVRTSIVFPFWVRTPMISNLTASPDFSDPLLEPKAVADAVVKQVLSGKGGQIFLPSFHALVSGIRGFPTWLQESIRDSKAGVLRNTVF